MCIKRTRRCYLARRITVTFAATLLVASVTAADSTDMEAARKSAEVGLTSRYTAAYRTISTLLPKDSLSRTLAGDQVFNEVVTRIGEQFLVWGPEAAANMREAFAVRLHWLNLQLADMIAANENIKQVVILGAGEVKNTDHHQDHNGICECTLVLVTGSTELALQPVRPQSEKFVIVDF